MDVQTIQNAGLRMRNSIYLNLIFMEIIEKGQCGERVSYELYEDGTLKIFGVGKMYNYTDNSDRDKCSPFFKFKKEIKKVIVSLGVTTIGNYAFWGCHELVLIDLSESIIAIGSYAFSQCSSLQKIVIPDSVTTIKQFVFSRCRSLVVVELGNSIVSIAENMFYGCSALRTIKIPDSVTIIENSAFSNCSSLSFIDIPDSVTKVGVGAFNHCSLLDTVKIGKNVAIFVGVFGGNNKLTSVFVDEQNCKYSSENGVLYNKDKSVLIKYPGYKKDTEFIVPESVVRIGSSAFADCCFLKKIKITKKVVELGEKSFYNCNSLRIVEVDGQIEKISYEAFTYSYNIYSISIVSEMPPIVDGEDAFISIVETAEICVPKNSINHYKAARGWNRFTNYVAIEDGN